jgi:nucleoside-diphosphate-sugar epimerase
MIQSRMRRRQSMEVARSYLKGARHHGIRLSHRFKGVEPLGREGRPAIVITGAGGTIGRILHDGLAADYEIRSIDETARPGVDLVADVRRVEHMEVAFAGAAAVIDLAADPSVQASWTTVREKNIAATVAVLEAARRAGVGRVVFASSNHVTGLYEHDEPYASVVAGRYEGLDAETMRRIGPEWPIRPDSFYGIGKSAGEAAGRYYAEEHGLSVLCLRVGSVGREDRPHTIRQYATFISHRDLVQLVRRCLEAPREARFGVFYGVSGNTWRIWDIDDAADVLGYEPLDDAESFRPQ